MDQFVTTYRKDYLWPYVRTIGSKPIHDAFRYETPSGVGDGGGGDNVPCECMNQRVTQQYTKLAPNAHKQDTWSRLAPTGPLLDPTLYPAHVGTSPENEAMRFNQPNVFLDKLSEKYPFLYEVLRTAPPEDIITRINRDRLRSTYQVDFGKMQEYPSAPYDDLLRAAGMTGAPPCSEPVRLPGDPCRPNQRPIAFRIATITKNKDQSNAFGATLRGSKDCAGSSGTGGALMPVVNITEYQEAISNLGQLIIKDRIHYHKDRKSFQM